MNFKNDINLKYETVKLNNGNTACIAFQKQEYQNFIVYNVIFGVSKKRKNIYRWLNYEIELYDIHEKTGFSLEGLMWAKNKIIEFENSIDNNIPTYIEVLWTDNKRRDVYERGLRKLGFEMKFDYYKRMSKKVVRK